MTEASGTASEATQTDESGLLVAVLDTMRQVAREQKVELGVELSGLAPPLDLPLLETGLDSIGFATVVALLEERLGFDPFLMMEEPIYPTTLGEFLAVYQDAGC